MTSHRWLSVLAAVYGMAAVVLAALGAHAIPFADDTARRLWDTASLLHLFHAAGMLGVAALTVRYPGRALSWSGWMMAGGTVLFSGSLYLRAAGIEVLPSSLAPIGGFVLIAAWLILAIGVLTSRTQ